MEHEKPSYDVVIIGGGVTGLAAAIYAGRFQMKTAVVTEKKGGTIILTDDISNYPGFRKISGLDLATKIEEHAKDYDFDLITKKVTRIDRCEEGCIRVWTGDNHLHTKTVIFATGTIWRKIGVPGEKKFTGLGVHYCALCDGPLYTGKVIAVVGGSDSAAKEALLLSQYAEKVIILVRGESLRPEPINLKRVKENKKIEVINNVAVTEIKGKTVAETLVLNREIKGSKEINIGAVFIDIGHIALSGLAKDIGVKLDKKGQIIIDKESQTNLKGIYAAGDVTDAKFKQAITGVGEGVTAAFTAYHYVNEKELICYCNDEMFEKS